MEHAVKKLIPIIARVPLALCPSMGAFLTVGGQWFVPVPNR